MNTNSSFPQSSHKISSHKIRSWSRLYTESDNHTMSPSFRSLLVELEDTGPEIFSYKYFCLWSQRTGQKRD